MVLNSGVTEFGSSRTLRVHVNPSLPLTFDDANPKLRAWGWSGYSSGQGVGLRQLKIWEVDLRTPIRPDCIYLTEFVRDGVAEGVDVRLVFGKPNPQARYYRIGLHHPDGSYLQSSGKMYETGIVFGKRDVDIRTEVTGSILQAISAGDTEMVLDRRFRVDELVGVDFFVQSGGNFEEVTIKAVTDNGDGTFTHEIYGQFENPHTTSEDVGYDRFDGKAVVGAHGARGLHFGEEFTIEAELYSNLDTVNAVVAAIDAQDEPDPDAAIQAEGVGAFVQREDRRLRRYERVEGRVTRDDVPDARAFGANSFGSSDAKSVLSALDARPGHNILPRGTYLVESDLTLSAHTIAESGAILKPASGATITLQGFAGDLKQHFDLSQGGSIVLEGVVEVYPQWFGAALDGVADDTDPISAAIESGQQVRIDGEGLITSSMNFASGTVHIAGTPGQSKLKKNGFLNIIRAFPEGTVVGTAVNTGSTSSIQVSGVSWTANEHAGKIVEVPSALGGTQRRWIASNTSDTLTLEEELETAATGSDDVTIVVPLESVEIEGIEFDGQGNDGANIVVQYAKRVVIRDVYVHDCGGNGITVNTCKNVRIYNAHVERAQFGIFVYNSDDAKAVACTAKFSTHNYNIQFKDCRNSEIIAPYVEGGIHGVNIKCSRLNPARNVACIGGVAVGTSLNGFYSHTSSDEGTRFPGENFSFVGVRTERCQTGLRINDVIGEDKTLIGLMVTSPQIVDSTGNGIAIRATDVRVVTPTIMRSQARGIEIEGSRNQIIKPVLIDNNYGGSGYDIRLTSGSDNLIDGPIFKREDALGGSTGGVQELAAASGNFVRDPIIQDSLGVFTSEVSFQDDSSKVFGDYPMSIAPALTSILTDYARPPQKTIEVDVTTTTDLNAIEKDAGAFKWDKALVILKPTSDNLLVDLENLQGRDVGFTFRLFNNSATHKIRVRLQSSGRFANDSIIQVLGPREYAEVRRMDEDSGGTVICSWTSTVQSRNMLIGVSSDNGSDKLQVGGPSLFRLPGGGFAHILESGAQQAGNVDSDATIMRLNGGTDEAGKDAGLWLRNEETDQDLFFGLDAATDEFVFMREGTVLFRIGSNGAATPITDINGNQVVGNRVIDSDLGLSPNTGDADTDALITAIRNVITAHGLGLAS